MSRRTEKRRRTQAGSGEKSALDKLRELMVPMVAGLAATKQELVRWVHEVGLLALQERLEWEAEELTGPKGVKSYFCCKFGFGVDGP